MNFETDKFSKGNNIIFGNKRWILFSVLIFMFIVIAQTVFKKELFEFDNSIYGFLLEHRNSILTDVVKIITQFGGAFVLIVISILCIILVKNKKYKVTITLNLIIIAGLNALLKNLFERQRPTNMPLIEETGFSFPSGHSMASMAFYGYIIYLVYKNVENVKLRYTLCILLSLLIILIGLSRIYLGVHYVSDVLAGLCFSLSYLILFISTGIYR